MVGYIPEAFDRAASVARTRSRFTSKGILYLALSLPARTPSIRRAMMRSSINGRWSRKARPGDALGQAEAEAGRMMPIGGLSSPPLGSTDSNSGSRYVFSVAAERKQAGTRSVDCFCSTRYVFELLLAQFDRLVLDIGFAAADAVV
jgi:hypothetical protein